MVEGVPNFHRIIDRNTKYNLLSKWHAYYFFNFNTDLWDIFNLQKELIFLHHKLTGCSAESTFYNTPKDGNVSRIWIVQYPQGGGYIQAHDHINDGSLVPLTNVTCMSEKGKDYESGGLFFLDEYGNKVYIDDYLEIGDVVVTYKKQVHGVEPIDPNVEADWSSEKGRWSIVHGYVQTDI